MALEALEQCQEEETKAKQWIQRSVDSLMSRLEIAMECLSSNYTEGCRLSYDVENDLVKIASHSKMSIINRVIALNSQRIDHPSTDALFRALMTGISTASTARFSMGKTRQSHERREVILADCDRRRHSIHRTWFGFAKAVNKTQTRP